MPYRDREKQRVQQKEYSRKYYQNPEVKVKRRKYARERYHKPRVKERQRTYQKEYIKTPKFKERKKAYNKKWSQTPEAKESSRKRGRENYHKPRVKARAQARYQELKNRVHQGFGSRCSCCGVTNPEFLTIDHINRDGKEHRKRVGSGIGLYRAIIKEGFPKDKYRLLCWNCNEATRYGRPCPHELERKAVA